ncbi:hypothetical protein N7517_001435 [Penicillium concentricum]|uniref:Myb-like DNA-binding domain-containing protein n=1 Tax=Penicillium concentricum TaxID=293559 RepID=A0A9W9SU11_9EURO|nr:uncharacterized protein N7517_001435 [Penicillium concentricum]KAJ5383524.1 hypothetical protein N7517_001435 [Penicillium concentricum]
MAPKKPETKSRSAVGKSQATNCNFKDEETMLIWKISLPALAEDLDLNVGAARMRWSRLKAKLVAFEKKEEVNKTSAAADAGTSASAFASASTPASGPATATGDTTMEEVDDSEEPKAAITNEDEK